MKFLNSFYAALGIGVTILATSIGIANKTLNPTQNVNSDLSYLTPQPAPVNPTNPSTTLPGTTISLKCDTKSLNEVVPPAGTTRVTG